MILPVEARFMHATGALVGRIETILYNYTYGETLGS